MRTPKPPAGFVPVDSEEGRAIDNKKYVNYCYTFNGVWRCSNSFMQVVRSMEQSDPHGHHHVQLPPPVEWEEVWGCKEDDHGFYLTKNGHRIYDKHTYSYIANALNEMEGRDG